MEALTVRYTLVDKKPVAEPDILKLGEWFETVDNRRVAFTHLKRRKKIYVSTVFLGIDHNFTGLGDPILFETMIFGTSIDGFQMRYSDWASAEKGHSLAVFYARQARQIRNPNSLRKTRKKMRRIMKGIK